MRRFLLITAAVVAAAATALLAVLLPGGGSATATSRFVACADSRFDTYDAGPRFKHLERVHRGRNCENPQDNSAPVRMNNRTSIYGDCVPIGNDGGCPPPLEIQSWPACERNLALYAAYPSPDGEAAPYQRTRIRGTEAAVFQEGERIEVYTGDATIVVMGESAGLTRAAANALVGRRGDRPVDGGEPLPAPGEGALAGTARC